MPLLAVEALTASYGPRTSPARVLDAVSLAVDAGEVVALLGANGAGKTTTLRVVSGLLRPLSGRVTVDGADLTGAAPQRLVRAGVAHVPAGRRLFGRMTVRENLDMAGWPARPDPADVARVHALFPVLADRAGQEAGTLSGGEQQMLALARALVARPRVLLLDEPSEGLAPDLVVRVLDTVAGVAADGCAVLLVEQDAAAALRVAARGYVLEAGRVAVEGPAATLAADPRLAAAYLGG